MPTPSDISGRDPQGWAATPEIVSAEMTVLGTAMTSVEAASRLLEQCPPGSYYRPAHAAIAEAIQHLAGGSSDVTPELVLAELDQRGQLDRTGGAPYLHELHSVSSTVTAALTLGEDVTTDHTRRRIHELGLTLMQRAHSQQRWTAEHADSALELTEKELRRTCTTTNDGLGTIAEDIDAAWDDLLNPQPPRVQTGLADLDERVSMEPGDVTTLAARTSVGKSMVASCIAQHAAIDQQVPVLFAALEMSRAQMARRVLSARARVRHDALQRPHQLTSVDMERLRRARHALDGAPLWTDYASSVGLAHLRHRLSWLHRTCDQQDYDRPGLVVVDYLGIMRATQQYERRQLELAGVMQGLRALAQEFELHMLVVHQLNREADGRHPRLTDLRESGDIEQDSANVLLLHLPDAEQEPHRAGELDIQVAKNRHGAANTSVAVSYQPHHQRVASLAAGPEHAAA